MSRKAARYGECTPDTRAGSVPSQRRTRFSITSQICASRQASSKRLIWDVIGIEAPAWEVYGFVFQPLVWLWVAGEYYEQKGFLRITYGPDETVTEIGRLLGNREFETEQPSREVFQETLKRAECGHGGDQLRVGLMYESGVGPPGEKMHGSVYVRRHIRKAYWWYALAARNQARYAVEYRDAAAETLSPEEIAEAERLVREWQPDPKPCEVEADRAASE